MTNKLSLFRYCYDFRLKKVKLFIKFDMQATLDVLSSFFI
ncbi:MAG: hypothetical protein JWQ54_1860 [Mucilaginibacter sp.]|nr:hypothetical protein [Mucilaginibacter sp.]